MDDNDDGDSLHGDTGVNTTLALMFGSDEDQAEEHKDYNMRDIIQQQQNYLSDTRSNKSRRRNKSGDGVEEARDVKTSKRYVLMSSNVMVVTDTIRRMRKSTERKELGNGSMTQKFEINVNDERFGDVFRGNPDYGIDTQSHDFKGAVGHVVMLQFYWFSLFR